MFRRLCYGFTTFAAELGSFCQFSTTTSANFFYNHRGATFATEFSAERNGSTAGRAFSCQRSTAFATEFFIRSIFCFARGAFNYITMVNRGCSNYYVFAAASNIVLNESEDLVNKFLLFPSAESCGESVFEEEKICKMF